MSFARFAPSLVTRLALALVLVGLLPVAILASRLVGLNRDTMDRQVLSMHVLFARSASEQVSAFVSTQLRLAAGLAGNPALAEPSSPAARSLLSENLQSWSGAGVLGIAIVDDEGEIVILAQLRDSVARRQVRLALDQPVGREVVGVPTTTTPLLRASAALVGARGFVWVVAEGEPLLRALDSFELGETQVDVALTTVGGVDLVGSSAGFPAELRAQASNDFVQGVDARFLDPETGAEQLGAYSPVDHTDWLILSRQPLEIAHRTAREMTRQSQIAVGLVAAAIAALSTVAYVNVVRPIRELAGAQRRLAGLGSGGGGSEIDQLKASFAALENRIREQQALDEVFLGRYQVLELLGTGAMGSVFLGRDPKLERKVAIKTVRLGKQTAKRQRRELVERLLQEAVITAKLNHPNVVAVYDVEDVDEAAFVAMEFVDGVNLEQAVWKLGKLEPILVLPLGRAIARGLAVAHQAGLVHRDVKPANILLGRDGAIKVVDFGIAEFLSSVAIEEDVVFGTPGYLPPETLRGKGYDAGGDLFSLGAVLYYCLTGRRAFEGKTLKEIVRKTLFDLPTAPSRQATGVPPELDTLILELLSADRDRRPSDAAEVADRLDGLTRAYGAVWHLPDGVFDIGERPGSQTGYLPTARVGAGG